MRNDAQRYRMKCGQERHRHKDAREPNVWEAWSRKYKEPHYLVGHFDAETGLFWREARKFELHINPDQQIIKGSFQEVAAYTRINGNNYSVASNAAKSKYGYSKKGIPPKEAKLGEKYGLEKVIIS